MIDEIPEIPSFLKRDKTEVKQKDIKPPKKKWIMPKLSKRLRMSPMQRDLAALDIVKAVGEGHFTFQKLRKHFEGKLDEKQLRSGLARAINMKYLRLDGRTYIKA